MARADCIHANTAFAEFIGPRAREGANGCRGGAINADAWEPLYVCNRGGQDDRRAVVQQRKGVVILLASIQNR